jgi:arylsulfatase A-like enzyme
MSVTARSGFWRGPWPWLAAALLAAGFALYSTCGRQAPSDPRPFGGAAEIGALARRDDINVLFVLIDTLRADRLHTYGYARRTSPLFDALAQHGVLFARHLSASSWTKCSMASLWTGLNPARSGVTRFDHTIPNEARMPAEIFREAGFRTAGLWRNGWVEGYFGFAQGFEVYSRPGSQPVPEQIRRQNPTMSFGGSDMDLVEAAVEFLRAYGRERWLLYLHLMDVHEYTYDPESARFGSSHSDAYDNAILHVNNVLDLMLGELVLHGQLQRTLIVIGSDHGEAFGERGTEGHARDVYPEVTEVPLLISFPFRLENPAVIRQRTANVDIWPTVLDLVGLPPLEPSDGRSRVPEILAAVRGETAPEDGSVAIAHLDRTWGQRVETSAPTVAISGDRFRYVAFIDADGETTREELFDTHRDPREQEDRLKAEAEVAEKLRATAGAYLAGSPPWKSEPDRLQLDEIQLNQLRALGYQVP